MSDGCAFHLSLFGSFRLIHDGEPLIAFAQPRLQFLLAHLVLQQGVHLSRQQLAFTLWPDTHDEQARTNLRNLLHRLRAALPQADAHLAIDRQTVRWRPESPLTLDVVSFATALAGAAEAQRAYDTAAEIAELRTAVDLYTGPLLPECYEDWIRPERERLAAAVLQAAERLIQLLQDAGQLSDAHTYAQRLIELDPCHEAGYRHLMQLRAASGDRTGVIRSFRACETVLKRELGAPVSEETLATYIRCQRIAAETAAGTNVLRQAQRPARGAIPRELTSLVGRADIVGQVRRLTTDERLVTLSGLGGVGKTRLAQRVAHEVAPLYADGVVWVDLAPVAQPERAAPTIAYALGLRENLVRSAPQAIADFLSDKQVLLVLDNCERLVVALRGLVEELLHAAPGLHILITSQRSLAVRAEQMVRVPPLPTPDATAAAQAVETNPSIQLFADRAHTNLPGFALTPANTPAVAQICRRLSGIPLAIELAAAHARTLTPQQIAQRLENAFALLSRSTTAGHWHQQTLTAAMDWTHSLLAEGERVLFRRLAAFRGVFSLEAIEDICATDGLTAREILALFAGLVDKSLVESDAVDGVTWFHLHEVVRQYATVRLVDAGEETHLRTRHLLYYARFTQYADRQTVGAQQAYWLNFLEAKHDNIRAALSWSLNHLAYGEQGLLLAGALPRFWSHRGHAREGLEWTTALIRATDHFAPSLGRAHALRTAGHLSYEQGEYAAALGYYERALEVARGVDHQPNIAAIVRGLGAVAHSMGDYARAIACYEESMQICRNLDDELGVSTSLGNLGLAWLENNDPARARVYLEQCLALRRDQGDHIGIAYALHVMADAAWQQGQAQEAEQLNLEALTLRRDLSDKWGIAYSTDSLGIVAWQQGRLAEARAYFGESVSLFAELGNRQGLLDTVGHIAAMLAAERQWHVAAVLLAAVKALRTALSMAASPVEQQRYAALEASLACELTAGARAAAEQRGRSLNPQELAAFAATL